MPKYKFKYEDKNFVTLLPNGEAVSLNGETVSFTTVGTKSQPPKTIKRRGITDKDLQKYEEHPKFKHIIERYFNVVEETSKKSKSKNQASSSVSKQEKKTEATDSES